MPADATPGQKAYEAVAARIGGEFDSWAKLTADQRRAWEAGAEAGFLATVPVVAAKLAEVTEENAGLMRVLDDHVRETGRIVGERDELRAKLAAPCPGCESLRVQCSELAGELGACKAGNAEYAERLRQAEATARLYQECEAELQDIHDTLVRAYGRDDLSEETAAVVTGMAAEWSRFRAALEEIRARGRDGYVIARVLWDVAVSALGDGADEAAETLAGVDFMAASGDLENPERVPPPSVLHVPDDGEEPTAEEAASLDDLEPLEGSAGE